MDAVSLGSKLQAQASSMQWGIVASKVGKQSQAVMMQSVIDAVQGAKAIAVAPKAASGRVDILA